MRTFALNIPEKMSEKLVNFGQFSSDNFVHDFHKHVDIIDKIHYNKT